MTRTSKNDSWTKSYSPEEIAKLKNFCEVVHTSIEEVDVQLPEVLGGASREEIVNTKDENRMEKKHSIFISYSHEDKEWLTKVLKYLKPLQRFYNNLDVWSDEKIKASDVWKEEIDNALSQATIAILIVSPDFESSDFITDEELQPLLEKAQKEGTKIMPLIVRPCAYFVENGLSKYQAINDPKLPLSGMSGYEQESKLVEMVRVIKEIIKQYHSVSIHKVQLLVVNVECHNSHTWEQKSPGQLRSGLYCKTF